MQLRDYLKEKDDGIDETVARELQLYIENDAQLYRQRTQPIIKNIVTKVAQNEGKINSSVKLWMYLVDEGAKKYSKEYSTGNDWNEMFNKSTRTAVAQMLADYYFNEIKAGQYTEYIPKKYASNYPYSNKK